MTNHLLNVKRNLIAFYIIVTVVLILYTIIHYFYGGIKFYLPFFIITFIGFTFSIIYLIRTKNYERTIFLIFVFGALVAYAAFLQGGIDKTGYLWSILLISVAYLLLPVKKANTFTISYTILLLITSFLHLFGYLNLVYNPAAYITIFLVIGIIIYVGNSVVREVLSTLVFLDKVANYDNLTRVYNRRKLIQLLQQEIKRVKRYNRPLSILLLDIDDFKKINDNYGHNFGDMVLKDFARLLREITRETDYVGRWGGEEFLVILPETPKEDALKVAEKIRKTVENYFEEIYGKKITVSIGLTEVRNYDELALFKIIDMADKALYKAKANGKNQVISH